MPGADPEPDRNERGLARPHPNQGEVPVVQPGRLMTSTLNPGAAPGQGLTRPEWAAIRVIIRNGEVRPKDGSALSGAAGDGAGPVSGGVSRAAAALSGIAGPLCVLLHRQGYLPSGLWAPGIVLAIAMLGVVVGWRAARRRPRWPGMLAVAVNAPILVFYGFLLAFFGLGASR